ncbi:OmpA family protein [Hydrocarboniclastica marina]|nr:OmpA family protein [Hydrocarboniclastica marina]
MSSHRHTKTFQSRAMPVMRTVAFISLGALAACAHPPAADATATAENSLAQPSDTGSPARKATNRLTEGRKDATLASQPVAEPKEPEMTVLVLEDHDLLALATHTALPMALTPEPAAAVADEVARPQLNRFHFEFGSHRLDAAADQTLREHARYLATHADQKVYITGHSDSQGAEAYNRSLSRLRAASVARILREGGVREKQMEVVGVGSDYPAAPDDHSANRRVELSYSERDLATRN